MSADEQSQSQSHLNGMLTRLTHFSHLNLHSSLQMSHFGCSKTIVHFTVHEFQGKLSTDFLETASFQGMVTFSGLLDQRIWKFVITFFCVGGGVLQSRVIRNVFTHHCRAEKQQPYWYQKHFYSDVETWKGQFSSPIVGVSSLKWWSPAGRHFQNMSTLSKYAERTPSSNQNDFYATHCLRKKAITRNREEEWEREVDTTEEYVMRS